MFENVTFDFYSDTLGRSIVPTEEEFDSLKLPEVQFMKSILPRIKQREADGIDSAVCMMIEEQYKFNQLLSGADNSLSSESVSGHSVSFDTSAKAKAIELNSKCLESRKWEQIRLFCYLNLGVCVK